MGLQQFLIAPVKDAVRRDLKPFAIPEDAAENLENIFQFRGRFTRRLGFNLLGRLQQVVTSFDTTYMTDASGNYNTNNNLITLLSLPAGSTIAPGSLVVVIGADTFTDNGLGVLVASTTGSGTINYQTTVFTITGGPATTEVFVSFNWYPNLPVMATAKRDLSAINDQNLIAFDTKYSYLFTAGAFELLPSTMPVEWSGMDYQLFYTYNYASSFWATNNNPGLNGFNVTVFAGAAGAGPYTVNVTATGNNFQLNDQIYFLTGKGNPNNLLTGYVSVIGNPTFEVTGPVAFSNNAAATGMALSSTRQAPGFDGIRYYLAPNNDTWVNYNPPVDPNNALAGALGMVAYKGYFVFLATWEGPTNAGVVFYPQRARWTRGGSPYYSAPVPSGFVIDNNRKNPLDNSDVVMRGDLFNGAGAQDAPTSEQIIGWAFIRDILVVNFQYSTWRLRFQQSAVQPFVWERVNVELGSQSTFSTIAMDKGMVSIGNRGIIISDSNDVKRLDNKIPNQVFEISQANNGPYRIAGIRTFRTRLIYWTFPFGEDITTKFPNRLLVYNYDTGNWSFFRDSFTCFGNYLQTNPKTWNDLPEAWSSYFDVTAQSGVIQTNYEKIVAGNQQGFVVVVEGTSQVTNSPSLAISAITDNMAMTPNTFTSNDHNLEVDDWVSLSGIIGTTSTDGVSLNGRNFEVLTVTENTFTLGEFESLNIGTVVTPWTSFTYQLDVPYIPIYPFSVQLNIGTIVLTDKNGDGSLYDASGVLNGTINYTTGVISLTFPSALSMDTTVYCRVVANQSIDTISTTGTYGGGGLITTIPNFHIQSKYFNFFPKAQKTRIHYVDFYVDQTKNGEFTCDMFGDGAKSLPINAPLPDNPRSNVVQTTQNPYQVSNPNETIYRLYTESQASTVQFDLHMSEQQMAVNAINASGIDIQAIILHALPSGRMI